jgi:hypothetical protein
VIDNNVVIVCRVASPVALQTQNEVKKLLTNISEQGVKFLLEM